MLGEEERDALDRHWPGWAHPGQLAPAGDWRVWVLMAGRGFGKTLAGAHWVAAAMRADDRLSVALVAATIDEARAVMVEGRSGLLGVAGDLVDDWSPSRRLLRFRGGATATLFSGASPDRLRGPEHHIAWCDELAKWREPGDTWDNLQLGLRLGPRPRALVTTTPRPGPVLRRIMAESGCIATRGATRDNPHLPPAYLGAVERLYAGTRLGRQEMEGELLAEGGALWTPETLEACRLSDPPRTRSGRGTVAEGDGGGAAAKGATKAGEDGACGYDPPAGFADPLPRDELGRDREGEFTRTVIGVDPPSGDGTCGIVACAVDGHGIGHILADHSVTARSPEGWARAVADAARVHRAGGVVAERNQGGKMVAAVLRAADPALPVRLVHASDGKAARAQPIALLFEAGRVRLHGRMPALEAELLGLVAGAPYQGPGTSPDRADAMVWALTDLMLGRAGVPSVRGM
jgi:phage terminase large subunit-like protein